MARYTDRIVSLERVRARDLVPHEANWRQHPESQVSALRGVLSEVGWSSALLAYRSNGALRLIDGHLRAGLDPDEQVPVLILDVDDAEAEKLLLSIDPLAAMAQANGEALRGLLERVETSDAGLQAMLADLNALAAPKQGRTDPDEVPEDVETRTKTGDLWLLGEHRLLCGDSTSEGDVERLMAGQLADCVWTDPPYGVNYTGGAKPRTPVVGDHAGSSIYADALPLLRLAAADHAALYLWYADGHAAAAAAAAVDAGYEISAQIIWVKNNAQFVSAAHYKGKHEPCFYAHRKGRAAFWAGANNEVTVWDVSRNSVNEFHPTQKPVVLAERAIENSCPVGGVLLDLFLGSGTAIIASEQLRRRCYGMEIDPHYCDVVVARWEAFTGEQAVLA